MSQSLTIEQNLSQQLNQFQLQSLNILALNNHELHEFLQKEFTENPLLDYQPASNAPSFSHNQFKEPSEDHRSEIKSPNTKSKKEFFMEQLNSAQYTKQQWKIIEYMIDCLDDDGLLNISLEEISNISGFPFTDCEKCHKDLLLLEPAGVFSRDLKECLKIQLERKNLFDVFIEQIIDNHLEDIAFGHVSTISKRLHISTAEVQNYIQLIQSLNPHPYCGPSEEKAEYITPDIIIYEQEEMWKIKLNDEWVGNYSLNDYYLRMMNQTNDPELKEYFLQKYQRCSWIISSIEQRKETMLKLSEAIFEWQKEFFIHKQRLKPMTMQDIANDAKLHVSTVSRASKGKYIQYPFGTISFKELFSNSYSFGKQDATAMDIKKEIYSIIKQENPDKPHSDSKIVQILKKHNIQKITSYDVIFFVSLNIWFCYRQRFRAE